MNAPKATASWITVRVEGVLSHYYRPETSELADLRAMKDWIDTLIDIPREALEQSFSAWVGDEERRPTPAAIRKSALARVDHHRPAAPGPDDRPFAPRVFSAEDLARRREIAPKLGLKVYDNGPPVASAKHTNNAKDD